MTTVTLLDIAEHLPPGHARERYQRLAAQIGGGVLAISVSYCDQALWLVESPSAIPPLLARGIARWRIWTLGEVRELAGAFGVTVRHLSEAAEVLATA